MTILYVRVELILTVCLFSNLFLGCSQNATRSIDARDRMITSYVKANPGYDDLEELQPIHRAYIGSVETREGRRYVLYQRYLLRMLCPRMVNFVSLFNEKFVWCGDWFCNTNAPPLWCEGSRVYLWGLDFNGEEEYNALDFSDGVDNCKVVLDPRFGSYLPDQPEEQAQSSSEAVAK